MKDKRTIYNIRLWTKKALQPITNDPAMVSASVSTDKIEAMGKRSCTLLELRIRRCVQKHGLRDYLTRKK